MPDIDYDAVFNPGENGQGIADSADSAAPSGDQPGAPVSGGPSEDRARTQTKEERARNAAARRKAEQDALIAKAKQEEREAIRAEHNTVLKRLGIPNPLNNGKRVESIDELAEYEKAVAARRMQQNLNEASPAPGHSPTSAFQGEAAVAPLSHPATTQQQALRQALTARTHEKIQSELRQINALDPSITKAEDLLRMDKASEFYSLVKQGNSFLDAFKLAHFDKLTKSAQAAAQQQTLNRARSKNHLSATSTRGAGAVSVPYDEMALYRELNPGLTDAEIQRHYNQYLKKQGRGGGL